MHTIDEIEAKFAFRLPDLYKALVSDGRTDTGAVDSTYLWLHEAEWMPLEDIWGYSPQDIDLPGFVPFAFTGAGDLWCWWPEQDREAVVLCPSDCQMGEFDAPSLAHFLYRRCLDYAMGGFDVEDESAARQQLAAWSQTLSRYLPARWCAHLSSLSQAPLEGWTRKKMFGSGFLSIDEYDAVVARELAFPRLNQEFRWTRP